MRSIHKLCIAALLASAATVHPGIAEEDNASGDTAYPISHLVVIFQENISFDHYFATYPFALNPPGEPAFQAKPGTPTVNGLSDALLTNNQNTLQPQRIDRSNAATADQGHGYMAEQQAFDAGLMDKFVQFTGTPEGGGPSLVMDYFDGNTVTALWHYAQHFALSDNSYGAVFGPSTPGALNVISGNTHGATPTDSASATVMGTVIGDPDPAGDTASGSKIVQMSGQNIGDLLNSKQITWGWFEGGFDNPNATHVGANGIPTNDYIPHHEPFQYYPQTANPKHLPPTSVAMIGKTDQANHQYDITRFWDALYAHNLPAVSYLKAPAYQDGHAGYSDPLLEQQFLVATINRLMQTPEWNQIAIIIAYDDSDGWYDHVMPPIVNQSKTKYDALTGTGTAGTNAPLGGFQGRAGYGPRLPLLVISPFAKKNFVDHTITDQSSIVRFIEDNWKLGRLGNSSFDALAGSLLNLFDFDHRDEVNRRLFLDASTGEPYGF
ncbi:MAG TPA: alkaline phosphatase family protein [Chthoniobacterales bacterium]|nr:alkaline phosphatase family protein [Chthoniobacterales bacterium]